VKKASAKKQVGDLPPVGLSQAAAHVAAVPETAAIRGEIPLMLPEKLTKGRFLVELEATEGGATDLAGDAGAVGRFSLSGNLPRLSSQHSNIAGSPRICSRESMGGRGAVLWPGGEGGGFISPRPLYLPPKKAGRGLAKDAESGTSPKFACI